MPLKIIFAGTPEFAATALAALLQTEHEIVAVYTQPDRKAGRGQKLTASEVKQLALEHHLPVYQPLFFLLLFIAMNAKTIGIDNNQNPIRI